MQEFPHRYSITAVASPDGDVPLQGDRLPTLATAPPAEFGGPGDRWSPETLLVAAVADCLILSFRSIASASKFNWLSLQCDVEGKLDRVERVTLFTEFRIRARLRVPAGTDVEKANRLLEKSEQVCLITRSLKAESHLEAEIEVAVAVG